MNPLLLKQTLEQRISSSQPFFGFIKGPTGTGKTYFVNELALELEGTDRSVVYLDFEDGSNSLFREYYNGANAFMEHLYEMAPSLSPTVRTQSEHYGSTLLIDHLELFELRFIGRRPKNDAGMELNSVLIDHTSGLQHTYDQFNRMLAALHTFHWNIIAVSQVDVGTYFPHPFRYEQPREIAEESEGLSSIWKSAEVFEMNDVHYPTGAEERINEREKQLLFGLPPSGIRNELLAALMYQRKHLEKCYSVPAAAPAEVRP